MQSQELNDYIKQRIEQGASKEDIKKELATVGWPENSINEAISSFSSLVETKFSLSHTAIAFAVGAMLVFGAFIAVSGANFFQVADKEYDTKEVVEMWGSSVVRIVCDEDFGRVNGSGTLWKIKNDYVVTTNEHVANSQACLVEVTPFQNGVSNSKETRTYRAKEGSFKTIEGDYDFLSFQLEEYESKSPLSKLSAYAHNEAGKCKRIFYPTGEKVVILGYPSIGTSGGEDLTVTEGIISGVEESFSFSDKKQFTWYVTSAKIEQGNSGGTAIASDGCFIGIPTCSTRGELESQGRIFIYGGESSFIINNLEALILWTQKI